MEHNITRTSYKLTLGSFFVTNNTCIQVNSELSYSEYLDSVFSVSACCCADSVLSQNHILHRGTYSLASFIRCLNFCGVNIGFLVYRISLPSGRERYIHHFSKFQDMNMCASQQFHCILFSAFLQNHT